MAGEEGEGEGLVSSEARRVLEVLLVGGGGEEKRRDD